MVFVAAVFVGDTIITFWRSARGIDDDAVNRRLQQAQPNAEASRLELLREDQGRTFFSQLGPLYGPGEYALFSSRI